MDSIKRIVTEGIESYLRHIITEDDQLGNGDGSTMAKLSLIDTLESLKEITLHYGEDETLELEGEDERYDLFVINYSLSTDAYVEHSYNNISGPEEYIMNGDSDDLTIKSITAWTDEGGTEIKIDDSDGQIENLIREKYAVDDSDYDYPTKEEYMDNYYG